MSKTGARPAKGIILLPLGLVFIVLGITFLQENQTAKYICLASGAIILVLALGLNQSINAKAE